MCLQVSGFIWSVFDDFFFWNIIKKKCQVAQVRVLVAVSRTVNISETGTARQHVGNVPMTFQARGKRQSVDENGRVWIQALNHVFPKALMFYIEKPMVLQIYKPNTITSLNEEDDYVWLFS